MKPNPAFHNAAIYYFSGTGNAQKVSYWIANIFQENDIQTNVINIAEQRGKPIGRELPDMIGFCSPTHGFNFPPVMIHFILRFPATKEKSVFLVNTRAGMKMGKWFLPGLSGMTQYFYAVIFLLKGYKIAGMHPIDLPSNWISLHPGLKEKVVLSIMQRCKRISEKFAYKLVSGKRDFRALYDLLQDLLITPIAFAYYLVGRFVLAKTFYANRHCIHCDKCIKDCPIGAVKKIDQRPFWTYRCESCMHCMNNCPTNAIQTAHGVVFAVFYVVIAIIMKSVWNLLLHSEFSNLMTPLYANGFLKFTIESAVALVFLIIAYRLMHFLIKIPLIERIVVSTSLTSYKFWRRFKGNTIHID